MFCVSSCKKYRTKSLNAWECVDACPEFVENGTCVSACSSNTYMQSTRECVDACPWLQVHQEDPAATVCVDECPQNAAYVAGHDCVEECSPAIYERKWHDDSSFLECQPQCSGMYIAHASATECVSACPDIMVSYGLECFYECPSGTFQDGTKCVETCSSGYYSSVDGKKVCEKECAKVGIP